MTDQVPSPMRPEAPRRDDLLAYLDYFRGAVLRKVDGLSESQLRTSLLHSGWTPLELVKHLRYVEQRWLHWGFEGHAVADPWGDARDDRWHVEGEESVADVTDALRRQGRRTAEIVEGHELTEVGVPGERWEGKPPATLERVLMHLVQEYARHLGHLDVVRELLDSSTGE